MLPGFILCMILSEIMEYNWGKYLPWDSGYMTECYWMNKADEPLYTLMGWLFMIILAIILKKLLRR